MAAVRAGELTDLLDAVVARELSPGLGGPSGASVAVVAADGTPVALANGGLSAVAGPLAGAPATTATSYDLASVTKVATTLAVMRLRADGLDIDQPVRRVVPSFRGGDRDRVTVRDLLQHRAGLWEWWPLYAAADDGPAVSADPDAALRRLSALPLRHRPGERYYSDLGFMLLGATVAEASGSPLADAVQQVVTGPLGSASATFGPLAPGSEVATTSEGDSWEIEMVATGEPHPVPVARAAAADGARRHWLSGEANDGNAARAFGGAAGHAGLFATSVDAARLPAALLGGHDAWPERVVAEFTAPGPDAGQALGWRSWQVRGADGQPVDVFGHPGFTGTQVAVAPTLGLAWAVLTNRLHPTSTPVDVSQLMAAVDAAVVGAEPGDTRTGR